MADSTNTTRFRFWLWLIRAIGVIVPRRLRADWRQEWEAELSWREHQLTQWDKLNWQNKLDLWRRSLGALWDALLLQPRRIEDEMFQDLRFGVRMLFSKPGFTLIALLTLSLGIGANTAIFSVVNAVLLRPLPYENPGQLVRLWSDNSGQRTEQTHFSPAEVTDFRGQLSTFEDVGVFDSGLSINLTGTGKPERLNASEASPELFTTLRVKPVLGRTFLPEESSIGQSKVTLISETLWKRSFAADPQLVGRTIQLDGESFTVVGVLPVGFNFPQEVDLWLPFSLTAIDWKTDRDHYYVEAVGRLKPGVTLVQAKAEVEAIAQRLAPGLPTSKKKWGITLVPLHEQVVGKISSTLWILFGAVGFVLLIACVNVANLLLTRAAARQKELTIRLALGAGRLRIVRQLLTESLLLFLIGGSAGALLAVGLVKFFSAAMVNSLPRAAEINVDAPVLLFTLLISLVTGVIFGIAPALQASHPNLNATLKEGGRHSTVGRSRLRNILVVAEIALSLVLLTGAGLLVKSFWRLQNVNAGFDPRNVLTMQVNLPKAQYPKTENQNAFVQRALQQLETMPGVKAAAATINLPLGGTWGIGYRVIGADNAPNQIADNANITPGYFRAMSIPLLKGRDFSERDTTDGTPVIIISESLARKHFANQNPLGQRIRAGGIREVIGVVADVKPRGLELEIKPHIYLAYAQKPTMASFVTFTIRTEAAPLSLANLAAAQITNLDNNLPVANVRTMEQVIASTLEQRRLTMWLLGVFASVAAALAAVGIYGVISYSVAQRTHEMGIRMALGAQGKNILTLVLGQGLKLILLGLSLGLAGALWLTGLLKELLFSVRATDPLTFLIVALALGGVALAACYLPARRATQVNPITALRHE